MTRSARASLDFAARGLAVLGMVAVLILLSWHIGLKAWGEMGLGAVYTVVVSGYVISRFAFAAAYRAPRDKGFRPDVAIIVPAFNEGPAVARTIHACLALDYPRDKLEIVVVNDGSADDTWQHMTNAAACYPPSAVRCIDLGRNQGKRAAMAAGIRATSAEIMVFIDSDSMPEPDGVRKLVQIFANPKVGAGSGLTMVRNADVNALTRMQQARYYLSFQLLKTAESVLGAVSCNPGCFAAYRRPAVLGVIERWERQRFFGVDCTFGDDRSLTNMLLRKGWRSTYHSEAVAWTDVPDSYRRFFKQQLRWKKSWLREGPLLLTHLWRTRPLAFPALFVQTTAGLLSPVIMAYNLIGRPLVTGLLPELYALALFMVACAYGFLYRSQRSGSIWKWAIIGTFFYIAFSPQLIWAAIRVADNSWGTRPGPRVQSQPGQAQPVPAQPVPAQRASGPSEALPSSEGILT